MIRGRGFLGGCRINFFEQAPDDHSSGFFSYGIEVRHPAAEEIVETDCSGQHGIADFLSLLSIGSLVSRVSDDKDRSGTLRDCG
jgi:hypothetical protein